MRKLNKNNKTGIRGVFLVKRTGRYKAQLNVNGRQYHIGHFLTKHDAARAIKAEIKNQVEDGILEQPTDIEGLYEENGM